MAVTAAAVASEIDAFLQDIASVGATSALSNVPLLGDLSLPSGGGFFQQLRTDVAAALSGVADDADAIANALKTVPGLTASVAGGNISIGIAAASAVDLGDVSIGLGDSLAGLGLDALGQFATKINAALDTALQFDGATGQLAVLDSAADELKVSITSDLDTEVHGKLGIIDVKIEDTGAPRTEIQLEVAIDLPTGDAAGVGGATVQDVTGSAGLDLQITSTVAKFLPAITTDLVVDFALDGGKAPTIALNNISIDVGGLFGIFDGTLKEVSELLDTAPLGEFIDLMTGPLPIVDSLAEKFGLENALDPVPALTGGDGDVSLADLITLQNTLGGGSANAFLEGLAIIGLIRDLGTSAPAGKITLGNITFSDDPGNPKIFTSLVGDKGTDEFDLVVNAADVFNKLGLDSDFISKSGFSIPLLEDPKGIVDLLFGNSPVTLVEYDLPDLVVEGKAGVFVPLLGPLGLTFTGTAKDTHTDFVLGYDTLGLTSGDFEQGLYLRGGSGGTQVATVHTSLEAGAALHAVVIEASATGSLNFQVNANLDGVDDQGRKRLSSIDGCLFELDGKATVSVQVEIKIDFGLFSFTKRIPILSEVIADYDLTHCDPLITPPDKEGLASVIGTDLVLNTGNRAGLRVLNDGKPGDDTKQPELYQIVHGATTDTLDVIAFGGKQSFGSAASPLFFIRGDLGDLDDSLSIAPDIGRWSNITGGKGNDFISGGAGRDTFDGGEGDDFLIGNDGDDALSGGGGRDEFDGGKGADNIDGGTGGGTERDRVSYEDASDTGVKFVWQNGQLVGFGGEAEGDTLKNIEYLVGTKFKDQLVGNPNESSTLEGLGGDDTLIGGVAGDFLLGGAGGDVLDGAGGEDGTSYLTSFGSVHIDMQRRIFFGGDAEGDTLIAIEQVQGSAYDDVIFGNGGNNLIDGFFGDDRLSGGAGKDTVLGNVGNDVIFAFGDGDELNGGGSIDDPGVDLLSYSVLTGTGVTVNLRTASAPDTIVATSQAGRSTFENLEGTNADDTLTGDIGYNTIWGLAGNDKINGDDGNDTLAGGERYDLALHQQIDATEVDLLNGGKGADLFVLGDSTSSYYTNIGSSSNPNRAVIADFNAFEGDQVQLFGQATDYRVETVGSSSFIYRLAPANTDLVDELIGEVQNFVDFDLTASYAIYAGDAGTFEPTLQTLSAPLAALSATEPAVEALGVETLGVESLSESIQALAAGDFEVTPQENLLGALGPTSGLLDLKISVSGSTEAIGTFKDDPFGLGEGIVLSTGRVTDLKGPNTVDGSTLPQQQTSVGFTDIGRIGETQIYKADLSQFGIDMNSLSLRDSNLKNAGGADASSGFDLDFIVLSTKELSPADIAAATESSFNALPKLDVFDYSAAGITFLPGTQRGNAVENLSGALGKLVLNGGHLGLLDADGFTDFGNVTLGDGGQIKFDLTETVSSDGPLYLYIGEDGAVGETVTGNLSVSPAFVRPDGDMSTDLGAPGLADDATRMTMSFTPAAGLNQVQFQFVMFSEELTEFGGSALPDSVKIKVNGIDFGRLSDGASATLDNLMMSPYGPVHPDVVLNPAGTGPASDITRADAYTKLITVTAPVTPGVENVIEIEVADHRDAFLDTGIMLKAGSFSASAGSAFPDGIAALPAFEDSALVPGPSGPTVIVSADVAGNEGNKDSGSVGNDNDISGDGRFVVFSSNASNLVPDDTNGYADIFVKDLETGAIERISVSAAGAQSNSYNSTPTISGDGRYVAFLSAATNLSETNSAGTLYVKDRLTGATVWSSNIPNFSSGASEVDAAISQDGRHIVFTTYKEPLPIGNFAQDVFVLDLTTGVFSPISTTGSGAAANDDSGEGSISGDGRYVVFSSTATNLAAGDGNGFQADIFLKDTATGDIRLISNDVNGVGGNLASGRPVISNDGRYVAFYSNANNLVAGDTNGATDVFRKDLLTGEIVRANTTSTGVQGNAGFGIDANSYLSMSGDGRFIAFYTANTNLVPGSGGTQIFVKDMTTGAIAAVTIDENGTTINAASIQPEISADGRYIALSTGATLVAGDTNFAYDVFRVPNPLFNGVAAPTVSIEDLTVFENSEGTAIATFTLTRSGGGGAFSVDFATANGSATAGSDYVATSGTASFAAGQTTATVSVTINPDGNFAELSETFFVDLTHPTGGAIIVDGRAQAIILDAPDPRTTIVSDGHGDGASITIPENTTAVTTVMARSLKAADALAYALVGGPDQDKFAIDPDTGALRFASAPDFEAPGDKDGNNVYRVIVQASDGSTIDTQIIDVKVADVLEASEEAGSVAISDVTVTEGDAGTKVATFTVTRTGGTAAFDVTYATADGTASAGSDYVGIASTVLSFGTNETSKEISVTINGDLDFEADETFFVKLSNATKGAAIGDGEAQGTIENDDAEPVGTVAISDVTVTEGDAGTKVATFTVARTGGTAAFDVTYATADGTATVGSDYVGIAGKSLSFGAGETSKQITVTINGDADFEADEDFFVKLSNATNGAGIGDAEARGTIENDDAEPAGSVTVSDVAVTEGNAGTKVATFTVTRTGGTAAFDLTYATADGTAKAGSDYAGVAASVLSFAAGETSKQVSVTINGDTTAEADETFFLNLSKATNGAVIGDSQGQGTIRNDDLKAIIGTNGPNILDGTAGDDLIIPLGGLDVVFAGGGNDVIRATVKDGADIYDGGTGSDTVDYSGLTAGVTIDLGGAFGLLGSAHGSQSGIDALYSIENAIGSQGADSISGSKDANTLEGRGGNDVIAGEGGADMIDGGTGDDTLNGGAGKDHLLGGEGRDILRWGVSDTLDGGAGLDTLLYADSGELDFDPLDIKSIEAISLGVADNNNNGIALSLGDVLALAAGSSGTGLSANGDAIDLFVFGDNTGAVRDNVALTGGWAASGTITTSEITGVNATFALYVAGSSQVAVQQGLDAVIS